MPSLLADVSPEKLVIVEDGMVKLEMGQGAVSVLGDLKVEGRMILGENEAAEFVALAAKVDAEIKQLDEVLATLKVATSAGLSTAGTSAAGSPTGAVAQEAFDGATAGIPGSARGGRRNHSRRHSTPGQARYENICSAGNRTCPDKIPSDYVQVDSALFSGTALSAWRFRQRTIYVRLPLSLSKTCHSWLCGTGWVECRGGRTCRMG